ncbi:Protein kinase PINOID [Camellia lanceoleosa]|uniref:Protein kinase PINOID n=1 Tax=Camellia lanceoleosa TaxID=1840588 RepID=A0ACC0ILV2_9ERIC|nr:Protein kinase PINOID [Camellia lanceoleosa]
MVLSATSQEVAKRTEIEVDGDSVAKATLIIGLLVKAIRSLTFRWKVGLGFRDFSIVRQIGSDDIGRVFLCYLRRGGSNFYNLKVVDGEVLAVKKKIQRAEMEKKILKMLDHPFLPTLYTEFEASNFSCIVMEYCLGCDLHSLRHKQPYKCFSYVPIHTC